MPSARFTAGTTMRKGGGQVGRRKSVARGMYMWGACCCDARANGANLHILPPPACYARRLAVFAWPMARTRGSPPWTSYRMAVVNQKKYTPGSVGAYSLQSELHAYRFRRRNVRRTLYGRKENFTHLLYRLHVAEVCLQYIYKISLSCNVVFSTKFVHYRRYHHALCFSICIVVVGDVLLIPSDSLGWLSFLSGGLFGDVGEVKRRKRYRGEVDNQYCVVLILPPRVNDLPLLCSFYLPRIHSSGGGIGDDHLCIWPAKRPAGAFSTYLPLFSFARAAHA